MRAEIGEDLLVAGVASETIQCGAKHVDLGSDYLGLVSAPQ